MTKRISLSAKKAMKQMAKEKRCLCGPILPRPEDHATSCPVYRPPPPVHVCSPHEHDHIRCPQCEAIHGLGISRGLLDNKPLPKVVYRIPNLVHFVFWPMTVAAITGWILATYFVSQPPIEKPYPVYITKYQPAHLVEANEYWFKRFDECQSDYRAQRQMIRVLSRKLKDFQP